MRVYMATAGVCKTCRGAFLVLRSGCNRDQPFRNPVHAHLNYATTTASTAGQTQWRALAL